MIRFLLALLLLASTAAAQDMTLEDAIALGLKNNFDIQIARNNARISDNNKGLGTAGFLPALNANGSYSLTDSDVESNSATSMGDTETEVKSAKVSLNWMLFDGFQMFANKSRYDALAKLGEYQARNAIESSVVGISRAYFNLVKQEQLLDVAQDSRDVSDARLSKERVRNELGGASSTDLLNAQVAFNRDQSNLLNQQLAVAIAQEELNLALGQDPATPLQVSEVIVIPDMTLAYNDLMKRAHDHNASLKVSEQSAAVADQSVKSARSTFMPKLALTADYGYTDRTVSPDLSQYSDQTTETTDATIGLALTFNIFNGNRDNIAYRNARIEANNQKLAFRDARNRLAGNVKQTYDTYSKQMELLALEEQNVQAARQNLELQQDRYRLGATSSLEFRDAQVSLMQARSALIAARFQARISRLELDQLTGELVLD